MTRADQSTPHAGRMPVLASKVSGDERRTVGGGAKSRRHRRWWLATTSSRSSPRRSRMSSQCRQVPRSRDQFLMRQEPAIQAAVSASGEAGQAAHRRQQACSARSPEVSKAQNQVDGHPGIRSVRGLDSRRFRSLSARRHRFLPSLLPAIAAQYNRRASHPRRVLCAIRATVLSEIVANPDRPTGCQVTRLC